MNRLKLKVSPTDAIAVLAIVLLTIGSALVHVALGFLVPGALLLLYAIAASRGEAPGA